MMLHPRPLLLRMEPNRLPPKILIIRQGNDTARPQALIHGRKNTLQILDMMQRQMRHNQPKPIRPTRVTRLQRRTRVLHLGTIRIRKHVINRQQILSLDEISQFRPERRYHAVCGVDAHERVDVWRQCEGEQAGPTADF
jgi:hypothetical protein